MKSRIENLVLGSALASVLALTAVGCSKPADGVGMPVATTTVGTEIDDSVITSSVKAALLGDADIKSFDFKVETRKGEVQLSGFVDNQNQIDRAIEVARGIEGVRSVSNEMSIKKRSFREFRE